MAYSLVHVKEKQDWESYHRIRRAVLFEAKGNHAYDARHADEYLPDNYPLLLKLGEISLGTTRLDNLKNGTGIVRLVAIIESEQGKGHGRVLGKMVEDMAKSLGIQTLCVNAAPEAIGYYKRLGWAPYVWDPSELKGIARDCSQMKKIL